MSIIPKVKKRIYCDNCNAYARAVLEGRNLCTGCLLSALMSTKEPGLFAKVVKIPNYRTQAIPRDRQI